MAIFTVTNTNDSGAGSLRQAILDSNAAGGNNTIEFGSSLLGQTITILSALPINANAVIDGDIDNDNVNGDVVITMDQDSALFTLDTDGVSLEQSANIDFDTDDALGFTSNRWAILVNADNASFANDGTINTAGVDTSFGDRSNSIQVRAENFTLINNVDGSIISEGRSAIEAFNFDDITFEVIDTFTTVINAGLLEATDDTVRLTNGSVTNTGTIRTTGTFNFGGATGLEPGAIADAILFFGPQTANYTGGPNLVDNSASGVIDGSRSGVFFAGGSNTLNNDGTITGDVMAVLAQGAFVDGATFSQDLIIENSGSLIRTGGNFEFRPETNATISIGGGGDSALITNSGLIQSTDIAIFASGYGATLNNQSSGIIVSDSDGIDADGIGEDGVAFRGARLDDFQVEALISFPFAGVGTQFESAQGIALDSNGDFILSDGTFLAPGNTQIEAALVGDISILALVDITATQNSGFLTFQTDANGTLYPATIDVTSSTLGAMTVNFVSGSGFTVTDTNGNPVYNVPQGVDFGDSITNEGVINGDIMTGLGDDSVTNSSDIFGNIDTDEGDDTVTHINGEIDGDILLGDGNDTFTSTAASIGDGLNIDAGAGNDIIQAGNDDDVIDGGDGTDTAVFIGAYDDYSFSESGGITTVTDNVGTEGTDTLENIELVQFSDYILPVAVLGADILQGTALDDVLVGTASEDAIFGFQGDDELKGLDGDDTLYGYAGDDYFSGGTGEDTIFGGSGNDLAYGGADNDTIAGDGGNDTLYGGAGDDIVSGGAGNDTLVGQSGNDTLNGGGSADTLSGGADNDILNGDSGNDTLYGQSGDDTINGGDGADLITGQYGNDIIDGGADNDNIFAGFGEDIVYGGAGDDIIRGEGQNDELHGGDGDDTLTGGTGGDMMYGDADNDTMYGQGGFDTMFGGSGNDSMYGGDANDLMSGQSGNDTLYGGNGNDTINGNFNDDVLFGNAGNDILNGGYGSDILNGGTGNDSFIFGQNYGSDTVNAFKDDEDTLVLNSNLGFGTIAQLLDPANGWVTQTDANTVTFDFGNGDIFTINSNSNFTIADLFDDIMIG